MHQLAFFFFFSILKATVSPLALSLSLKVFGKKIMISLSVMRSGVHVRPTGFFEEELGFGRREKRIVRIRRVLGLGRGIRVLDKPHLYSHRERERERKYRLLLLSSCRAVYTILTKNITHSPLTLACTCTSALSLSLSLSLDQNAISNFFRFCLSLHPVG